MSAFTNKHSDYKAGEFESRTPVELPRKHSIDRKEAWLAFKQRQNVILACGVNTGMIDGFAPMQISLEEMHCKVTGIS